MPADWIQPYSCVLVDVNIDAYKSSHWFLTLIILDEISVWSVGWISYLAWIVLLSLISLNSPHRLEYPHRLVQSLGSLNVVRTHFSHRLHGRGHLSLNRFCQTCPLRQVICGLWGDQTFEDEVFFFCTEDVADELRVCPKRAAEDRHQDVDLWTSQVCPNEGILGTWYHTSKYTLSAITAAFTRWGKNALWDT